MIRQMCFHQSITHRAKTMFSAPSTLHESTGTRASSPLSAMAVQVGGLFPSRTRQSLQHAPVVPRRLPLWSSEFFDT